MTKEKDKTTQKFDEIMDMLENEISKQISFIKTIASEEPQIKKKEPKGPRNITIK